VKEWTIMIYLAGDNNLSVDMAYTLEQIKGVAGTGPNSPNLFVYYDGNSPSIPTLYCDFSVAGEPKYIPSYSVQNKLFEVTPKYNENNADKRSVVNFVDWCVNGVEVEEDGVRRYGRRAKRYALIFSGHSLGFQDIGLFKDETSGKSMKMVDLYEVLGQLVASEEELNKIRREMGLEGDAIPILGQKLDILGFDSCVMGMLEVGYQFGSVAKTMIASEGSVPSAGWTYAKLLGSLASGNGGEKTSTHVAANFVRNFIKGQDSYTVGGVSVDMAAWDLENLNAVAGAFDVLSQILIFCFDDPSSRVYRQMERVILMVHWKCQSYMFDQNVDLGDFCELLHSELESVIVELGGGDDLAILRDVQTACEEVLKALPQAVILSGFSGGEYQYSNGISVFFPWSREGYEVSRKNYEGLWFTKDANRRLSWTAFLHKYLNEVALRRFEEPVDDVPAGARHKYYSGIKLLDLSEAFAEESFETVIISDTEDSKIAGSQGSKIAGSQGSKIAGSQGSKIAGSQGSKIAGSQGSKIAGSQGSKLAGGGSDKFFDTLKLFKNIESRWNVSGFTKKEDEGEPEDEGRS
jgi:hypothetical protein